MRKTKKRKKLTKRDRFMPIFCSKCGKKNSETSKYCNNCTNPSQFFTSNEPHLSLCTYCNAGAATGPIMLSLLIEIQ